MKVVIHARLPFRRNVDTVTGSRSAPARSAESDLARRRIRLLATASLTLILTGAGGGVYYYIASAPQRAAAEFLQGVSMMTPGNYHLAVRHFNRALELDPDLEEVYVRRGIAYQNLGQIDQAMQDFDRALAVNPRDGATLTARGILYRDRKDLNKAIDEFSRVIEVRADTNAYYERALAYEAIGEHAKAVADFNRVIQDLQNAPHVLRARALAKRKMGDEEGFKADIDAAVGLEIRSVKNSLK